MMQYKYCLLDTKIENTHRYGIAIMENESVLEAVLDLSLEKEAVTQLVDLCNQLALEWVHLFDVIEDYFVVWDLKYSALHLVESFVDGCLQQF